MALNASDLTQRPPRSARVRLGGFVIFPRLIDKGRATVAGKNGEFHYNCPLDQHFFHFVGVEASQFKEQIAAGKGDWELLQWVQENGKHKRTEPEIMAWSAYHEQRVPTDHETRKFFNDLHQKAAAHREDIATWFDLLDLDDHVSYGGQA
ncbi:MAG: DUF5069 domain-containing protein [Limisphaerales bacterium]